MQRKKRRQSMQVDFHKLNLSGIVQSKTTLRSTVSLIENQDFNTVENEEIKMTKKQTFHVYQEKQYNSDSKVKPLTQDTFSVESHILGQ